MKVGIVGYGTVGKRVADAVACQPDMELVGITVNSYNHRIHAAVEKGYKLYSLRHNKEDLQTLGLPIVGDLDDLFSKVDIIVDGTPKAKENIEIYKQKGIKAIVQGGEKADSVESSFNAQSNFDLSVNKNLVRVVSCGTTGLSRTLGAIKGFGIKNVAVTILRRWLDPDQQGSANLNAIQPSFPIPSHHGHDVQTIHPDIDIHTVALKVPTTLMHVHSIQITLEKEVTEEQVIDALNQAPRVFLIPPGLGIHSTAQIVELGKDLGFPRGDFMHVPIWQESIKIEGNTLYLIQAIHQESIIVPENIDAIRAMMGETDFKKSMQITDKALGLEKGQ